MILNLAAVNRRQPRAYGECCGAPAVLFVDLPLTTTIPEPSTWAMMGIGFVGLGFVAFRRARKERAAIA